MNYLLPSRLGLKLEKSRPSSGNCRGYKAPGSRLGLKHPQHTASVVIAAGYKAPGSRLGLREERYPGCMLVVKVYILGVALFPGDFGLMAWFFEYALIRKET